MAEECLDTGDTQQPRQKTITGFELDEPLLLDVIETEYGLLDELYSSKVITQQQLENARCHHNTNTTAAVRSLLDEFKRMLPEKQEQFLSALDKTDQSHVSNYIRNNGQQPTTDSDDWPLQACQDLSHLISNWRVLKDFIDSRNGLLDELLAARYINDRQKQIIAEQPGDAAKNELLLKIYQRKSVRDHMKFIDCLRKTNQHHLVSLLEPHSVSTVQLISEEHRKALTENHSKLIGLIDLSRTGLIDELFCSDVITSLQREYIKSADRPSESRSRLLEIIKRGSEQNYLKFIECLDKMGQWNVTLLLCGSGVVAEMVAKTSLSKDGEEQVKAKFFEYFRNASPEIQRQLLRELSEQSSATSPDFQLIGMETGNSIKLYIYCTSLRGLQHLRDLLPTEQLKSIIEHFLSTLLNREQLVTVHSLEWSTQDYNICAQYLSAMSGLKAYSTLHRLAQQSHSQCITTDYVSHSMPINELPHELLEHVLLKATGQLFVVLKKMVSRAHIVTVIAHSSVCDYWSETLTFRQINREILIKYFNQQCAPYKCKSKLLCSIRLQECLRVHGIAELFDKLFIACEWSDRLIVYSIVGSSYDRGEEIKLPEKISYPRDMVACRENSSLYISDYDTRCIWQVSSSSLFQDTTTVSVKKFIVTEYRPCKLSVQSSRLLVTVDDSTELHVYSGNDGKLKQTIELPEYMLVNHAIETSDNTVIVCHSERTANDENPEHKPSVSEVSRDGRIVRAYKGEVMFEMPWYVTNDSENHILICDVAHKQIVHLNRKLELQRIVLAEKLKKLPFKTHYSEERSRLYISHYEVDATVNVYSLQNLVLRQGDGGEASKLIISGGRRRSRKISS